jgi:hypothetical protein
LFKLSFQFYSDDEQLYVSFYPVEATHYMHKMQSSIIAIQECIIVNKMALNVPKTEFLIIGTPQQLPKLNNLLLKVNGCAIEPTKEVTNIHAIFDEGLTLSLV